MQTRYTFQAAASRGFTFLEILIVVMIIGVLTSMTTIQITRHGKYAKIQATKSSMKSIETALEAFSVMADRFPTSDEGLQALLERPDSIAEENWHGRLLKQFPTDAWGRAFVYSCPGKESEDYDLFSCGPDGQPGSDDDITLVQPQQAAKS